MADLSFILNGKKISVSAQSGDRLSQVLREQVGLYGTKVGCDAGDCGACTVLLNNEAVCACMVPAGRLQDQTVTTIEGLTGQHQLSRLQQVFLHYGAAQCGICTPGMLMSAAALLDHTSYPTEQQVQDALGGVLCRCTGYRKIIQAVMAATDFVPTETGDSTVGRAIARLDGQAKVLGTDQFGADSSPADALVVKVIRSPYHHARFALGNIDTFLASHPGLQHVLTAADIPGQNRFGVIPPFIDQPVFAEEIARFRGEAVAAIVGDAAAIAAFDPAEFPIHWTELPHVLTPETAQTDNAPLLHHDRAANILTRGLVQRGDVEQSLAPSDIKVEGEFSTGFIEHAYIEPEAGFAQRIGDRIEVHCCTQAPGMNQQELAAILGLEQHAVRIVPTAVGGGFGSKLDLSTQPYIALAAWLLKHPVKILYSRPESMMSTTKRHPAQIKMRVAATKDGKITSLDFFGTFNTGAYASWGPTVANRVPVHASGPYFIPNYRARSVAVHTHCMPSGAFRGFGVPQTAVAQESLFDELADAVGMDRLAFRINNALDNNMPTVTGQIFNQGVGIKACLQALQPYWQQARDQAKSWNIDNKSSSWRRGVGLASAWYGCGNTSLPNPSTIKAGIRSDGSVVLHQGAVDIGQGSNTVITQIFATTLGIDAQRIVLLGADTDITPDAGKTSASRQTFVSGNAARLTATSLRKQILRFANFSEQATIEFAGQRLILSEQSQQRSIDLATLAADVEGYALRAEETYDPPVTALDANGQGKPYALFGYAAHLVELEVDLALGKVQLQKVVAAHDVGRAINPNLVEGQIEGGVAQGIGLALMEEFIPGRTENLHDYLIPTIGDVPEVTSIIIEQADDEGPYGAKGLGEHVLIATAPAILNAIYDATGARIRQLPATPDRVFAALRQARLTA